MPDSTALSLPQDTMLAFTSGGQLGVPPLHVLGCQSFSPAQGQKAPWDKGTSPPGRRSDVDGLFHHNCGHFLTRKRDRDIQEGSHNGILKGKSCSPWLGSSSHQGPRGSPHFSTRSLANFSLLLYLLIFEMQKYVD